MEQISEELSFENDFSKEKIGPQGRIWIIVIALVLVTVGILVLIWILPRQNELPVFSEVMSSNHAALEHPQYGTVDWVEIYNPTEKDIDLSGYGFTNE